MKFSTITLIPALFALGMFAAIPAFAEPTKNGEGGGCNSGCGNGGGNGGGKNGGGGGKSHIGGGGGTSASNGTTCYVGHTRIRVVHIDDCYEIGGVTTRKKRRVRYEAHGGGKNGGGYAYGEQRVVRYYQPVSRAAQRQAERRARKAAHMDYGYEAGFAVGGGYSYGNQVVVVQPRKHKRKKRMHSSHSGFNAGVVIHYGPVVTKGGGY